MKKSGLILFCSSALLFSPVYAVSAHQAFGSKYQSNNGSLQQAKQKPSAKNGLPSVFSSVRLTKKQEDELNNLFRQTQEQNDKYRDEIEKNKNKIKLYIQQGNSFSASQLIGQQYDIYKELGLNSALEKNTVYNILKPNQRTTFIKALEKEQPNCCSQKANKKKSKKFRDGNQPMALGIYKSLDLNKMQKAQLDKLRKARKKNQDESSMQLANIAPKLIEKIDSTRSSKKDIEELIDRKYKVLRSQAQFTAMTQAKIYRLLSAKQKNELISKLEKNNKTKSKNRR